MSAGPRAWLDHLGQDLRIGFRSLRRNPGFTVTIVATMALATGATTALLTIVDGVLLRPLPFERPAELAQLHGRSWRQDRGGEPDPLEGPVSALEIEAYRNGTRTVRGIAGYSTATRVLEDSGGPERVTVVEAEANLFELLGAGALIGRTFGPGGPPDGVVVSERFWTRRWNRDPRAVGRAVTVNGVRRIVLGVMPDRFQFPYAAASVLPGALPESRTDLWLPLEPIRRGRFNVIARLAPGVTVGAAGAELTVLATRLEAADTAQSRYGARLVPLREAVVGPVDRLLGVLFGAVALVLIAACVNVANLLLSRSTTRVREIATRAALGAGRPRLIRQLLTEAALLAAAAALVGLPIARAALGLVIALGAATIPRAHEIAFGWRTFGWVSLLSAATALLFGLAPALTAARVDLSAATRDPGAAAATAGRRHLRIRDALVVGQVALAFLISLAGALVVAEMRRLQRVETGMSVDRVVTVHVAPQAPVSDYSAIEAALGEQPGIEAAGFIQLAPLQHWGWDGDFVVRSRPTTGRMVTGLRYVTPGYFDALGIPIRQGRGLLPSDVADGRRVILVNEALVRRYFPGEDVVGLELDRGWIVGVTGDVRQSGLDRPAEPEVYYPIAQNIATLSELGMTLVVRTSGPPEPLVGRIRETIHRVNPGLATFKVRTMRGIMADSLWELDLYRWSIGMFAALTLVLAAIGLAGVISFGVASRRTELAVRLALGARSGRLVSLVVGRGLRLTAVGLAIGAIAAVPLTPLLAAVATGIGRPDLGALLTVAAGLVVIAIAASLVPALRIGRLDPAGVLRHE